MNKRLRFGWVAGGAVVLVLIGGLIFTPLSGWIGEGIGAVWQGFLSLPGVSFARGQLQPGAQTPPISLPSTGGATTGSQSSTTSAAPQASNDTIDALLSAGQALQAKGSPQDALQRYQQALKLDDKYPPTHLALSSVYDQLGREDEALAEAQTANQLAPNNPAVLTQLGSLQVKKGNYDDALVALQQAAKISPNDPVISYWLGAAYYLRSYADTTSAVTELENAAKLAPDQADIHMRLGMAYMRRQDQGDTDKAIAEMQKALQLDPSQTDAYLYLGQLYLSQGKNSEAIAAWQKYVVLSSDTATVSQVKGWLRNLGQNTSP